MSARKRLKETMATTQHLKLDAIREEIERLSLNRARKSSRADESDSGDG